MPKKKEITAEDVIGFVMDASKEDIGKIELCVYDRKDRLAKLARFELLQGDIVEFDLKSSKHVLRYGKTLKGTVGPMGRGRRTTVLVSEPELAKGSWKIPTLWLRKIS
jgi:hypothetical protein